MLSWISSSWSMPLCSHKSGKDLVSGDKKKLVDFTFQVFTSECYTRSHVFSPKSLISVSGSCCAILKSSWWHPSSNMSMNCKYVPREICNAGGATWTIEHVISVYI